MAGRGPLPTGDAIRRNKPTIPTTNLPAAGRSTPIPPLPATYELGEAGRDWWGWAWRTPQACGWDDGQLFTVAARAQLEDAKARLLHAGEFDWEELLCDQRMAQKVKDLVATLKALSGGMLAVEKLCVDIDGRLGLTPKGLAELRWKIVEDEPEKATAPTPKRRRDLTVVPDSAAG